MSDTLYIHIIYWSIIILILLGGYIIYIEKNKKSNKQLEMSLRTEQDCRVKDATSLAPPESSEVLLNMPSNETDWKCLESYIDNTYDGFIKRIRNSFPLSNEDIHLIIFICLGVSNKKIASYYHIQLTSLATHRYRIGKKMGLKEVKSINEAIIDMMKNEKR